MVILENSASAILRGGDWDRHSHAGVFAAHPDDQWYTGVDIGFRCTLSLLTELNYSTEESDFEFSSHPRFFE